MYGYEYPPSKQIQEYGPLAQGSHFYAEGKVEFLDHRAIDCSFEVGYSQDCKIAIVLYLPFDTMMSIFGTKDVDEKTRAALAHFGVDVKDKESLSYSIGGRLRDIECSRIYGECKYSGYRAEIVSPR